MKPVYIIGAIVIVGMLLLSGCVENQTFDVNKVIEAQKNVKQYEFESKMSYGALGMTVSMPMNGKVDVENKKAYINMSMMGSEMEMYIIGDEMYIKQAGQWIKMTKEDMNESEMTGMNSFGDQANQYEKTTEILKSPKTKINVVGEEKIDDVLCYKVNVVPDEEVLKEQMNKEMGAMQGNNGYDINVSSYTIYVDKATNLIKKEDMNLSVEMSVQDMKMKMDAHTETKYTNINKPIDIQLPEEAKNAKSMKEMLAEETSTASETDTYPKD